MQVDLIVCFDSDASPIRNIQRMGRTGRHKAGKVVYIMAKGKEEESYKKGLQVRIQQSAYTKCQCCHFQQLVLPHSQSWGCLCSVVMAMHRLTGPRDHLVQQPLTADRCMLGSLLDILGFAAHFVTSSCSFL